MSVELNAASRNVVAFTMGSILAWHHCDFVLGAEGPEEDSEEAHNMLRSLSLGLE